MIKEFPFKRQFLTGLTTLLPVILSILLIVVILNFLVYYIGLPIGREILFVLGRISHWNLDAIQGNLLITTFIGIMAITMVITIIGYLANLSGRQITRLIEDGGFGKLPFIRIFYPYTRQIASFVTGEDKKNFRNVVVVEYPREGIYSLGFITSDRFDSLTDLVNRDCVSVFIPASPTPFTGSTIFVPKEKVLFLAISVDEALKILISGGILTTKEQKPRASVPGLSQRGCQAGCPTVARVV